MKKKLFTLLLALVAIATTGRAQVVLNSKNFPDANFRKALATELGISEGSVISKEMIAATKELHVYSKSISDLTGIDYFTALTWLDCHSNNLTSLSISGCTYLIYLDCDSNKLTSLDLSGCTTLRILDCSNNNLTSLNLSKNTALEKIRCYDNQLTSLDVSKNTELRNLEIYDNQLTSLDVSNNTELRELHCHNNSLRSLDVSKNTALTSLWCYGNHLRTLDVSKNIALTKLSCALNRLTSLDVSKNSALTRLLCYHNLIKNKEMDALVASLPTVENGGFYVTGTEDEYEGNVCTKKQVAVAKAKGWTVCDSNGGEYEGSEDAEPAVSAEAIDLGLPSGTKWANMNVGASRPEEYGTYFAWGETLGKNSYTWDNYMCPEMTCGKSGDPVFDLVGDKADIAGTKFDAATMNWGASWQMPTAKQIEELASNCYSSLVTINGVQCRKLKSRINGNEIVFPLAGARWYESFAYEGSLCYYWGSTLRQGGYVSPGRLIVEDDRHGWGWSMGGENDRFCGFPIRPVKSSSSTGPNLTLGTKVLTLTMGESVALTYTYEPADADISAMTWTTSDSSVATVDRNGVVTAVSEGSCNITVTCGSLGQQECRVLVDNVTGVSSGHEYVDLGLPSGTLWATTNVGAETPGETGSLFSWGETESNAATVSWGSYWQMPIREQLEELIACTSSVYTSLNDTEGILLTSLTNGKCIFLPVTTSTNGCYWSGTAVGGNKAYALNFSRTTGDILTFNTSEQLAIRPVYNESVVEGSTFTVSAGNLDFGTVAVGSRRSMSFGIHNNTFGVINVKPFGVDADDFFVDWTGGKIQPNATQSVNVTYSPSKETVAAGGSLLIATAIDSLFVNVAASSHKSGDELTTKANLVVWCKNGAKVSFLLNDKPIVKIKDGKWKIDGNKTSAEYDVADVVKITYDGIPDDIPTIGVEIGKPFTIEGDVLTFFSDSEDLHVRIVALSGVVVKQFVARRGSASPVPLNQFASGVYIVNVNNISYKISIR